MQVLNIDCVEEDFNGGKVLRLYNIWVNPPLRGHGIGRACLVKFLRYLSVIKPNMDVYLEACPYGYSQMTTDDLVKFYMSVGFVSTGYIGHTGIQMKFTQGE